MCDHFVNITAAEVSPRFSLGLFQTHFNKAPEGIIRPEACTGAYKIAEKKAKQNKAPNNQTYFLYMRIV